MNRREALGLLAGGVCAAAYAVAMEPRWLKVARVEAVLPRGAFPRPVRLLHLSDLHLSAAVPLSLIRAAVRLGLRERPDLICLTGDFITGRPDLRDGAYAGVLSMLSAAAPAFAVLGNHDGGQWARLTGGESEETAVRRLLSASGVRLLHNESTVVQTAGAKLTLVGLGDLWACELEPRRAFRRADPRNPTVALAHNPDSKDELRGQDWDLMLSGHTHGGQIGLPLLDRVLAPVNDARYVAGLRAWGRRQIYVTRGVGSLYGARLFCRPEVSLLTLKTAPRMFG